MKYWSIRYWFIREVLNFRNMSMASLTLKRSREIDSNWPKAVEILVKKNQYELLILHYFLSKVLNFRDMLMKRKLEAGKTAGKYISTCRKLLRYFNKGPGRITSRFGTDSIALCQNFDGTVLFSRWWSDQTFGIQININIK